LRHDDYNCTIWTNNWTIYKSKDMTLGRDQEKHPTLWHHPTQGTGQHWQCQSMKNSRYQGLFNKEQFNATMEAGIVLYEYDTSIEDTLWREVGTMEIVLREAELKVEKLMQERDYAE
jgi:hypothetical protein